MAGKEKWDRHDVVNIYCLLSLLGPFPRHRAGGMVKQGNASSGCLFNLFAWVTPPPDLPSTSCLFYKLGRNGTSFPARGGGCVTAAALVRTLQHMRLSMQPHPCSAIGRIRVRLHVMAYIWMHLWKASWVNTRGWRENLILLLPLDLNERLKLNVIQSGKIIQSTSKQVGLRLIRRHGCVIYFILFIYISKGTVQVN